MLIGGAEVPVLYVGPQGDYAGLDQVNVELPRSLFGKGESEIALSVEGRIANRVRIDLGGTGSTATSEWRCGFTSACKDDGCR